MSFTDDGSLGPGALDQAPDVQSLVRQKFLNAGYSPAAAAGIAYNINAESGFHPELRHPDQPRWGGEAHYAHGLYQDGGQEWLNYQRFLQNRPNGDWRDPGNQTDFVISRLKSPDYAITNASLSDPNVSPQQAASAFMHGYLRPAAQYAAQRQAAINRWNGSDNYQSVALRPPQTVPPTSSSQPTATPTMSNSYLADEMQGLGGPQRPQNFAQALFGAPGQMSPMERAGIYLMSVNNPQALQGLAAGSKDAEARNAQMLALMRMHQSKNQFEQQEFRRRSSMVPDPSGDVNALTGKPTMVPQYQLEGLQSPYAGLTTLHPGTPGFPSFSASPQAPQATPQGAAPAPAPSYTPTATPIGAGNPPEPTLGAGPTYTPDLQEPAQLASAAAPGTPPAATPAAAASPAAMDGIPAITKATTLGQMQSMGDSIGRFVGPGNKRDPGKVEQFLSYLDQANPNASAYLRGVMTGEADPLLQRPDKMAGWYSALNSWLPALSGKDSSALHTEFLNNQRFLNEDLNPNKAGSIAYRLQSVRTFAKQGGDLNPMFAALGNTNGNATTPWQFQEGVNINGPFGNELHTPNANAHYFGQDHSNAVAFDRYTATLGREINKYLSQGSGNGTEAERNFFGGSLSSTNTPFTHYAQMQVMDKESRSMLESARESVAAQFGEGSSQYTKWYNGTYLPTLQGLNKIEHETEVMFNPTSGSYYKDHPEAAQTPANAPRFFWGPGIPGHRPPPPVSGW